MSGGGPAHRGLRQRCKELKRFLLNPIQREKRMTLQLQTIIGDAWENRANIHAASVTPEVRQTVEYVIAELDAGRLRVASRAGVGQWTTHQWIKKAVLLSFRLTDNILMRSGD